jgi:hypothetical protein
MSWDGQRPLRGLRARSCAALWGQVDWPIFFVALLLLADRHTSSRPPCPPPTRRSPAGDLLRT